MLWSSWFLRLICLVTLVAGPLACGDSDVEPDAGQPGPDARVADAGRRDATVADAGPRPDASPPNDAASPDVSSPDAGSVDADMPDAALEDAGIEIDAGPIDAGPVLPPCGPSIDAVGPVQLRITADDARTVYINGALVEARRVGWNLPSSTTHSVFIHPLRPNTIAIHVENLQRINGFDRGLIAELTHTTSLAVSYEVLTSSTTRVATSSVAGWTEAEFDDSTWSSATVQGPHGMAPWGAVFGASNAQWVWTYDSNIPAGQKPDVEAAFARMNFYVHRDGRLSSVPDTCAP